MGSAGYQQQSWLKVEKTSKGAGFIRPLGDGCITI
jgi:hypothetical protein